MPKIKISVVMATYNGEKYIIQQLESILPQLDLTDEIIISDDNSTDQTITLIERICDKRIRVVMPTLSKGPIFNFENGLMNASGDVIVLSDQDDIWLNGRVKNIREYFSRSCNSNDLLVLDSKVVDDRLCIIESSVFDFINAGPGIWKNFYRNTYIGCHMAFKRNLLKYAIPFPSSIPMHDVWLGLVSELVGVVTFCPGPTMLFRRTGNNYTKSRYSWGTRILWRINLGLSLLRFGLDYYFLRNYKN